MQAKNNNNNANSPPKPSPTPSTPANIAASIHDDDIDIDTLMAQPDSYSRPAMASHPRPQYKEVVVVGNGPSGIALSYFLAGNWPYYSGHGESVNEMLHYRLLAAACSSNNNNEGEGELRGQSIVEQDLGYLAQGLEGRSANPTSLLFDTLNHPQADLGLELPSLLSWSHDPKQTVDHVVIGRHASPGGTWQDMDGSVLTISLGCWMELPQLNFREWEAMQGERCCCESRATVSSVAQYYSDYVRMHRLQDYFLNDSVVTDVARIDEGSKNAKANGKGLPFPDINDNLPSEYEIPELDDHDDDGRPLWRVNGYTRSSTPNPAALDQVSVSIHPFTFLTRNLVLATGASDQSNVLNIPGENLPFVLHSLTELERLIATRELNESSDPILIVGAGLCAADAIIAARFYSIPIIHVFRRSIEDPNLIFRQLPENMYPEYHKVYQMMRDSSGSYDRYKALPEHSLIEIGENRTVKIEGPFACGKARVSNVVICIGSHPDLSFLGPLASNLGLRPGQPIDCKVNPIAIDPTTHEAVHQPGLYGLGPLVGENFVRFLQGGALAITSHLAKLRRNNMRSKAGDQKVKTATSTTTDLLEGMDIEGARAVAIEHQVFSPEPLVGF